MILLRLDTIFLPFSALSADFKDLLCAISKKWLREVARDPKEQMEMTSRTEKRWIRATRSGKLRSLESSIWLTESEAYPHLEASYQTNLR